MIATMDDVGRIQQYRAMVRQYGWRRCVFRLAYDVRRRRGWLHRRFPAWEWSERPLATWLHAGHPADPEAFAAARASASPPFFTSTPPRPHGPTAWARGAIARAEGILAGDFPYFNHQTARLGFPEPSWFTNPLTGGQTDPRRHWLDRDDFEPGQGDIKLIWEPSRFIWVYDLVRAHAATADSRFADAFWALVDSWREANSPNMGPNWQCGQEVAIRALALLFGLEAFGSAPAANPQRIANLVVMIAASAERIAANIAYARAQMGNHATSEAAALVAIGRQLPELRLAKRWLALGLEVLGDESNRFHWPDGSYVQHSFNYHRLMLDAYLWAGALGQRHGDPLPARILERLDTSWQFLHQNQDPTTGRLPNYGPNDGAQILPLHGCGFLDYRPIIDACCMLTRGGHADGESGPWREKARWLFADQAGDFDTAEVPGRRSTWFAYGGYQTLRGRESWAMIRCHTYGNRPNQADMLHLDLWWRGWNILRDSGTSTYYDPETAWHRYFVSTAAHNTIRVGGAEQMVKGDRFRWYTLLESRRVLHAHQDTLEVWVGEHYGYRRLPQQVTHRRAVVRHGDVCWIVVDDLTGHGAVLCEQFWHLDHAEVARDGDSWRLHREVGTVSLTISSPGRPIGSDVYVGADGELRAGWESLHYATREPAPTIRTTVDGELPIRLITVIGLAPDLATATDASNRRLTWRTGGTTGLIELDDVGAAAGPLVSARADAGEWRRSDGPRPSSPPNTASLPE